ncbi:MAG: TlpA disulfide reductase family protein [Saprospiraceae bacterium]|mgnify:CR=1 FL=1|nr:TlpA disulfide reductase family protein [Saprospiraceae bacterium]
MKQFRFFAFFAFAIAFSTTQAQTALPSVELKTLDGKTVNLKDYVSTGKITVISFWATWCAPCKKELTAIADLYPEWQEKYNAQLLAVTIDTQRALAQVRPLVETEGWEYIILSDANNQLKNALNFQAIPQTYLVDQQGNIVYSHSSYVPGDEFELEAKIKALAGKE